jgi:hypothetical protein
LLDSDSRNNLLLGSAVGALRIWYIYIYLIAFFLSS